jgi:Toprim-like/CHC2 zinc finger
MSIRHISCREAKETDLIQYLQKLGFKPSKIKDQDHWYLSPFRNEKTPSFKVNRKKNLWFDFGKGIGGTIIDFGIRYYHCSVKEFLYKLEQEDGIPFSFHQPIPEQTEVEPARIIITDCRQIADPALRQFLHLRNIPLIIANRFCSEIEFELYGKKHLTIGFKNDQGGYEFRSADFKGSSSPKSVTWIKNNPESLSVFEGFFDFLSFQTKLLFDKELIHALPKNRGSYIILNSLAFLQRNRELMEQHQSIHLYLDRDEAGLRATRQALEWSEKYGDKSHLYHGYKDLNEYHIERREDELKQSRSYKHGI